MPTKLSPEKAAERVMVVAREDLFHEGTWHGLKTDDVAKLVRVINTKHKFMARGEVEDDPAWQQVIPYMFFENGGEYFLMQRNAGHTDKRLASNYSLGVGGHINKKDIKTGNIVSWAKREFEEEVDYKGRYKAEFLGLLNDDTNDVGRVHVGLIIKMAGNSNGITVRDEHQSGEMVGVDQLAKNYKKMETWSQIVYDYLVKNKQTKTKGQSTTRSLLAGTSARRDLVQVTGILPDWVIVEHIEKGLIQIDPLARDWKQNIDQVSVDFHLGSNIKLFRGGTYRFVDTKKGLPEDAMEVVKLNEGDPFILEPGAFAIASTKEVLRLPKDVLGRLEGKSSLARLGILVHSTAARFDPGWNGAPVLELGNLGPKPAILYCGMPICAFTFEKLSAPVKMGYEGSRSDRYSGSRDAVVSKIHEATGNGKKK
jgi:dCTP deaminase